MNQPYPFPAAAPTTPSTGVKVLAIFQIIFGVIGLFSAPIGAVVAALNLSKDPLQQKLHAALWEGPTAIWSYSQAVLGTFLGIVLIVAGIGLFRGKRFGRTAGLVYAITALLSLVIGQVVMCIAVYPMLLDEMNSSSLVTRAGATGGLFGGIGAAAIGTALPLITLIALTRRSVRQQLA